MTAVRAPEADALWTSTELTTLLVRCGFAVLLLIAAWVGTSGTADLETQAAWMSLGIGGLVVGCLGGALFLQAGMRRVWTVIADLHEAAPPAPAPQATTAVAGALIVAGAGMTKYHLAGCALTAGRDVAAVTPAAQERAGHRPCRICNPDVPGAAS